MVKRETSAPCCTAKQHQGRKTEGRHPEADLGNLMLVIILNHSAGPYKIYKVILALYIFLHFSNIQLLLYVVQV